LTSCCGGTSDGDSCCADAANAEAAGAGGVSWLLSVREASRVKAAVAGWVMGGKIRDTFRDFMLSNANSLRLLRRNAAVEDGRRSVPDPADDGAPRRDEGRERESVSDGSVNDVAAATADDGGASAAGDDNDDAAFGASRLARGPPRNGDDRRGPVASNGEAVAGGCRIRDGSGAVDESSAVGLPVGTAAAPSP
jgi:hypothetical protein